MLVLICYHTSALIDTGAVITGFDNFQVAQYLLQNGLSGFEACIFLDRGSLSPLICCPSPGFDVESAAVQRTGRWRCCELA